MPNSALLIGTPRDLEALFDANTILAATADNTPFAATVQEDRLVGRLTGGSITALTGAQVLTMMGIPNVENTAVSTWAGSANITTVGASAVTAHQAALSITESQISDLGTAAAMVADNLSVFAATTSAQLAGVISDETGSGALVFGTSPTLTTPALGTPSALVLTSATGLPAESVLAGTFGTGAFVFDGTTTASGVYSEGSPGGFFSQRTVNPQGDTVTVGYMDFRAYSTGTTYVAGARIKGMADGAWTGSSTPGRFEVWTVPSGSTTLALGFTVESDQTATFASDLNVTGAATFSSHIKAGYHHGNGIYGLLGYRALDGSTGLAGLGMHFDTGIESPIIFGYDAPGYTNLIRFSSLEAADRNLDTGRTDRMTINMETGQVRHLSTSPTLLDGGYTIPLSVKGYYDNSAHYIWRNGSGVLEMVSANTSQISTAGHTVDATLTVTGTAQFDSTLTVQQTDDSGPAIKITPAANSGYIEGWNAGTGSLQIHSNGPTWFNSGNVSIGTASDAGYKLGVTGTFNATGAATLGSTLDVTGATTLSTLSASVDYESLHRTTFSNTHATGTTQVDLAIGHSVGAKYLYIGTNYTNADAGAFIDTRTTNKDLELRFDGTQRMRFGSGSSYILGTLSVGHSGAPAYGIDLSGTLNATGAVTFASTLDVTGVTTASQFIATSFNSGSSGTALSIGIGATDAITVAATTGAVAIPSTLDVDGGYITVTAGGVSIPDSMSFYAGTGSDLRMWHDGTQSWVYNSNSHLYFGTATAAKVIYYRTGGVNRYQMTDTDFSPEGAGATEDLGTTGKRWGTIYGTDGDLTGTLDVTGKLTANGAGVITSTAEESDDTALYVYNPTVVSDWGIKVYRNTNDYGILAQVGAASSYGMAVFDTNGSSYVWRVSGAGTMYTEGNLVFGGDTNLYRSAANTLKTDHALVVAGTLNVTGTVTTVGTGDLVIGSDIAGADARKIQLTAGERLSTDGAPVLQFWAANSASAFWSQARIEAIPTGSGHGGMLFYTSNNNIVTEQIRINEDGDLTFTNGGAITTTGALASGLITSTSASAHGATFKAGLNAYFDFYDTSTAANLRIQHSGGTTYLTAGQNIAINSNGVGNVVIGSATATTGKLNVWRTDAANGNMLYLRSEAHGYSAHVHFYAENDAGTVKGSGLGFDPDSEGVYIGDANGSRFFVGNDDNVGIGTSTVTAGKKLDVVGGIISTGASAEVGVGPRDLSGDNFLMYNPTGDGLRFWGLTDGDLMVIKKGGNVGIGTNTPSDALDITGYFAGAGGLTLTSDMGVGGGGRGPSIDWRTMTNDTGSVITTGGRIAVLKDNATHGNEAHSMYFYTTPNGGSVTEAVRIEASGQTSFSGHVRPLTDSTYTSGTATERWSTVYADTVNAATLGYTYQSASDTLPSETPLNFYMGFNTNDATNYPSGYGSLIGYTSASNGYGYAWQLFKGYGDNAAAYGTAHNDLYFRSSNTTSTWKAWRKILHVDSGNALNLDSMTLASVTSGNGILNLSAPAANYSYLNFGHYTSGNWGWQMGKDTSAGAVTGTNGAFYLYDLTTAGVAFSIAPTTRALTYNGAASITGTLTVSNGTAALPSIHGSDVDTGFHFVSGSAVGVDINGSERWRFETNSMRGANGSATAPTFSFLSDSNSGMYYIGADNFGLTAGGSKVLDVSTSGLAVTGALSQIVDGGGDNTSVIHNWHGRLDAVDIANQLRITFTHTNSLNSSHDRFFYAEILVRAQYDFIDQQNLNGAYRIKISGSNATSNATQKEVLYAKASTGNWTAPTTGDVADAVLGTTSSTIDIDNPGNYAYRYAVHVLHAYNCNSISISEVAA